MMAVIPIDYVWVDANYKETQLTHMRIGQPARVWLDIYGSKVEYRGKVLGIASGRAVFFAHSSAECDRQLDQNCAKATRQDQPGSRGP